MNRGSRWLVVVTPLLAGLILVSQAHAKTTAWSGGGADKFWTTAANWTNGVPTAGAADVVRIMGTAGSPYLVNMNNTSARNVDFNITTMTYTTVTNGQLDWDGQGALYCTNVTFAPNAKVFRLGPSATLSNVVYNNTGNNFGLSTANGTHRYFGGYLRTRGFKTAPSYGWGNLHTILLEGYAGPANLWHEANYLELGHENASTGQSFLRFKNTRLTAAQVYVGWDGANNRGRGQSTFTLTNSLLRVLGRMNLNTNAIFKVGASELEFQAGGGLVTDGLRNRMTNAAAFDGEGLTVWAIVENPGMTYEVSGTDTGAVFSAFHDNYSVDQFKFGLRNEYHALPFLVITNQYNNDGRSGNEALYTDVLVEVDRTQKIGPDPTFTIKTYGLNIYYKKYVEAVTNFPVSVTGGGALIQVTGAALMSSTPYVHAPENAVTCNKGAAPVSVNSDYGTAWVNGFANGDMVEIRMSVSGTQGNIDAMRTELGGGGGGNTITLRYDTVADGSDLFFDWNFSHRSVTLSSLSADVLRYGTHITVK